MAEGAGGSAFRRRRQLRTGVRLLLPRWRAQLDRGRIRGGADRETASPRGMAAARRPQLGLPLRPARDARARRVLSAVAVGTVDAAHPRGIRPAREAEPRLRRASDRGRGLGVGAKVACRAAALVGRGVTTAARGRRRAVASHGPIPRRACGPPARAPAQGAWRSRDHPARDRGAGAGARPPALD